MDLQNLKYDIQKNKSKIMFIGAVLAFILSIILVFKVFGVKLNYGSSSESSVSNKYVLATNILGASKNGAVNLYDLKTGEVVKSIKLEGEDFLYSISPDMKKMNAYNEKTKILYEINAKSKKITNTKIGEVTLGKNNIVSFKYSNNTFVGLLRDENKLICIDMKKSKQTIIDLKLNASINNYEIVGKNVIFTSGDYICTAKMSDGKGKKINIGALSSSIHITKNKVFVHNTFGSDRNKSILLDINPETLYINKAYQFKDSRVNILQTSKDSDLLYYSEEFLTSTSGNVKQVFKTIGEEMKNPASIMKHVSKSSVNKFNSYGYLGYIYYRDLDTLQIFNLRNSVNEYTLKVYDDFYMPVY